MGRILKTNTALLFSFVTSIALCQTKEVTHNNEVWIGHMASARLYENYSLWSEAHFLPGAFGSLGGGVTRNFNDAMAITAGYAHLWLPSEAGKKEMRRHEHQPWSQLQVLVPLWTSWRFTSRVRYEARFRENIQHGEVTEGYIFNNRVRMLVSVRKSFRDNADKKFIPYVALVNETLLNFGKQSTCNTFDQNRLSFSFGLQQKQAQYQLGLMNRYVQTARNTFVVNHTIVFTMTQQFDLRSSLRKMYRRQEPSKQS